MWICVLLLAQIISIPAGLDTFLPVPETNPLTIEKIKLGRQLFFDKRLSRDRSLSCASCHDPKLAFGDSRKLAVGVGGKIGSRRAPRIVNRVYGSSFFWDGRAGTLEDQVLKPISDPNEMDLDLTEAVSRVGMDSTTLRNALASYVRTMLSGDARIRSVSTRQSIRAHRAAAYRLEAFQRQGRLRVLSCRSQSDGRTISQHGHWRAGRPMAASR